jgi:fructoselysine 6-kinase
VAVAAESVVACFGDNCIDRYLPPLDLALVGGSCVNVAVGLRERGIRSAYIGAVGADADGERVVAELKGRGISVERVAVDPAHPTAVTEIEVTAEADRRFVYEDYAIHDAYEPSEVVWALLATARHVHASRLPRHLERLVALEGPSVSYDFSDHPIPESLVGLDIAFASGGDPATLVERGARCAVVTLGASGSLAAESTGALVREPSTPVAQVVDTCGAGDAFIAAFLASQLADASLAAALAAGSAAGADACAYVGAFPQPNVAGARS